jgi:oligopeptide/dipeptide ABC transporter ATP-binding protein
MMDNNMLLEVNDLKVQFTLDEGILKAVDGVDLSIKKSSTVGLIGESGCGKSVTARAIMRIVSVPGKVTGGSILFNQREEGELDLTSFSSNSPAIRAIRGRDISMIFQEPMTSLSPVHTIGQQISEALYLHRTKDRAEAKAIVVDMLDKVGMSNPSQRYREYPHQLSGGMRQRAMIAMSLSCNPSLLIADEPTTALDVTVQAQILELMSRLQKEYHMSILYITHNLGVIAEVADTTYVMYLGRIVEHGTISQVFEDPKHPYTERLLKSIPRFSRERVEMLDCIRGNVPIPIGLPPQCGFHSRCDKAIEGMCDRHRPALTEVEKGHRVRCFLLSDAWENYDE